ncbi:MAG: hypothetical protein ACI4FV_08715 [Lachnospiraceae bacterium]
MEKEEQKKQKSDMDFYADTMELEKTKKSFDDMNCQKGLFVNDYSTGLNNDKGVFNSTAIFKTSFNEPL